MVDNAAPYDLATESVHYGAIRKPYDPAEDSTVRGFYKGPTINDTLVIKSHNTQQTFPCYDTNVPPGEIWTLFSIEEMLCHPWASRNDVNPMDLIMHVFAQNPDRGMDASVWSTFGHFAQWREPQPVKMPDNTWQLQPGRVVTDTSEGTWAGYHNHAVEILLFGPCRLYVGIWNGNPIGWPNASAHLTLGIHKGYHG